MAEPIVWENIPKSQTDPQTILEAILEQITVHNADSEAHMGALSSVGIHRENEIIDHPALSVLADKLENNPSDLANKTGSGPLWGNALQPCSGLPTTNVRDIVYTGFPGYEFMGSTLSSQQLVSTDGIAWTYAMVASYANYNRLQFVNDRLFRTYWGSSKNTVYVTTDGATWNTITLPENSLYEYFYYFNGVWYYLSRTGSASKIRTTTDFISWTLVYNTSSFVITGMQYVPGYGVLIIGHDGGFTSFLYRTTDFSSVNLIGTNDQFYFDDIVYGDGIYLIYGSNFSGDGYGYIISKNGSGWTKGSKIVDAGPISIHYALKQFVIEAGDLGTTNLFYSANMSNAGIGLLPTGFQIGGIASSSERVCISNFYSANPRIMYADLPAGS